jgi:inhibitor of cysteine peptidase
MTPVVLFFLTLPLFVGLSLVYGEETVIVTKAFNGREIKVRNGSMIQVELNQAGSAGYVWEIEDLDKEHFEVVSVQTPEPPAKPDFVGGPVKKMWLIRVTAQGKFQLKFIHARPWEGEEKTTDTFVLKVRIL